MYTLYLEKYRVLEHAIQQGILKHAKGKQYKSKI